MERLILMNIKPFTELNPRFARASVTVMKLSKLNEH